MPYPNEHACRLKSPGDFTPDSFRRITQGKLSVIIGRLRGQSSTTPQAYRYPVDKWTEADARAHCFEAGGQFEAAAIEKAAVDVLPTGGSGVKWPEGVKVPDTLKPHQWYYVGDQPPVVQGEPLPQFARFIPITKVDVERREVWGIAAEEAPDKLGEIMDFEASVPHFIAWSKGIQAASGGRSLGNVRAMHGKVAAGKLIHMEPRADSKTIYVGAKVVDEGEWKKVIEGVYTGFSIGGSYGRRWADPQRPQFRRYEAKPIELSLVDNPAMYGATFEVVKANGQVAQTVFIGGAGGPQVSQLEGGMIMPGKTNPLLELPPEQVCIVERAAAQVAVSDTEGGAWDKLQALAKVLGLELDEALVKALQVTPDAEPAGQPEGVTADGLTKALEPFATSEDLGKVTAQLADVTEQLDKLAPGEDLTKLGGQVQELTDAVGALTKRLDGAAQAEALTKLDGDVVGLVKRVETIEAQPQAGGPLLRAVSTGQPGQAVALLDEMIDNEPNPVVKEALGKRRATLLLKRDLGQAGTPVADNPTT